MHNFLKNAKNYEVDHINGIITLKWKISGVDFVKSVEHKIYLNAQVLTVEEGLRC